MNELETLLNLKMKVLKQLEDAIPNSIINIYENDYLCYYMKTETVTVPVIDLTRFMPCTIKEYKSMIQESANEWYSLPTPQIYNDRLVNQYEELI